MQGSAKIMEKLGSLTFQVHSVVNTAFLVQTKLKMCISHTIFNENKFPTQFPEQKIAHLITAVDCQPMFDGGILINVLGQLKVGQCLYP